MSADPSVRGPPRPLSVAPGGGRLCGWCDGPTPPRARADSVYCSTRCRQASHRFGKGRALAVASGHPLRLVRRDIFAPASTRWADPRAQLLSGAAWEAAKAPVLNALQLPEDPEALLAGHAAHLDDVLRYFAGRLDAGVEAFVDDGRLHAGRVEAVPDPPSLTKLRDQVEAMMPEVDIGELVLEVMSWVPGFVRAFEALAGAEVRMEDLHLSIAAALVAWALNIDYVSVANPGVKALTRSRISHVDQKASR